MGVLRKRATLEGGEDTLAQEAEHEGVVEEDSESGTTTQRNTEIVREKTSSITMKAEESQV